VEKKKMLKTSVSTAAAMASIATQEIIGIAQGNPKWTYEMYYNILMTQAIADDRTNKRKSKGTNTQTQLNYIERLANAATQDGAATQDEDGTDTQDGAATQDEDGTDTQAGNNEKIQLTDAIWSSLPPGAQNAIKAHNNTMAPVDGTTTQANMHTQMYTAAQFAQMSNAPPQVFGPAPPATQQLQQANVHGQTPAATPPPDQQQGTPNVQNPIQPFQHQLMSSLNVQPERPGTVAYNGYVYYRQNKHTTHYKSSQQETKGKSPGALVDGGANGGFGGDDVLVIDWGVRRAHVTGIDSHKLVDLPIVTCLGLIMTTRGPAIAVMHQYAYHG
jgi:hypothetical protein